MRATVRLTADSTLDDARAFIARERAFQFETDLLVAAEIVLREVDRLTAELAGARSEAEELFSREGADGE